MPNFIAIHTAVWISIENTHCPFLVDQNNATKFVVYRHDSTLHLIQPKIDKLAFSQPLKYCSFNRAFSKERELEEARKKIASNSETDETLKKTLSIIEKDKLEAEKKWQEMVKQEKVNLCS